MGSLMTAPHCGTVWCWVGWYALMNEQRSCLQVYEKQLCELNLFFVFCGQSPPPLLFLLCVHTHRARYLVAISHNLAPPPYQTVLLSGIKIKFEMRIRAVNWRRKILEMELGGRWWQKRLLEEKWACLSRSLRSGVFVRHRLFLVCVSTILSPRKGTQGNEQEKLVS